RLLMSTPCSCRRPLAACVMLLLGQLGCGASDEIAAIQYQCETVSAEKGGGAGSSACGADDPNLPPEPTLPTEVCQTLKADKTFPDEKKLDTDRIQDALDACKGKVVKLERDGTNTAFLAGHLAVDSVTLWVDADVTLYASRDA